MLRSLLAAQIGRQRPTLPEKTTEMTNPRAFISFDYDNNLTEKTLFVGQIKKLNDPVLRGRLVFQRDSSSSYMGETT